MNSVWAVVSVLILINNVHLSHQSYRDTRTTIYYKWRFGEFEYPSEMEQDEAVRRGQYIPENILVFDSDYHSKYEFAEASLYIDSKTYSTFTRRFSMSFSFYSESQLICTMFYKPDQRMRSQTEV